MKVDELKNFDFENFWIERFKLKGIEKLYDYQRSILEKGLLNKSFILASPTASGKTLIAMLKMIKSLKKGKVVYVVPLVALAVEKYEEFKKFFEGRYKVALSVGDYDSTDPWLKDYDVIVLTVEKMDSLIRHGVDWIKDISLLVVDEIHLLTDASRGPTLEVLLVKMKELVKHLEILGLSATISNADEIADWLGCEVFKTDFRPVTLHQGVAYDSVVEFVGRKGFSLSSDEIEKEIVLDTLKKKKQILIFVSTRRRSESLAEKLSKIVSKELAKNEKQLLAKIGNEVENVLEVPTKQCERLAKCVRNGTAFHHAGLVAKQKRIVEENFRKGLIKVIVATPTLSMGVNTPAFRVLIRDAKRYYPGIGSVYIPVLEYHQMVGRAGRPGFDKEGESILVAKNEEEADELKERYIFSEPEPIKSKLASEPAIRMHTLALVASGFCRSVNSVKEFFSKTFFAYQFGDFYLIEEKIDRVLEELVEWKMLVERKDKIFATRFGKRVSELYLDPLTAWKFYQGLKYKNSSEEFGYLHLISNSIEMLPLPSVSISELIEIENFLAINEDKFLCKIPEEFELEYEDFVRSVKLARMFEDWINEATEEEILEKYKTTPGELHSRLQIADWLVYSLEEIANIFKMKEHLKAIRKLRVRLRYGVKEELLNLVRLEGIGRVRARKLYNVGIKTVSDLRKVSYEALARLIGVKVARKIKDQVEGKKSAKEIQKTLF